MTLVAAAEVRQLFGISEFGFVIALMASIYGSILLILGFSPKVRNSFFAYVGDVALLMRKLPGIIIEDSIYSSLRPGEMQKSSMDGVERTLSDVLMRISDLENNRAAEFRLSDSQAQEVREEVIRNIKSSLSEESRAAVFKEIQQEVVDHLEASSLRRLSGLSVVLGSRARLTLWMGVLVCGGGILSLYFSFFYSGPPLALRGNSAGWLEFAASYAPRFSLVILVELIGLFFLKLYKSTLGEIRFVQNEITNVEMRLVALHSSYNSTPEVLASTIALLAATERNSIIEKSQTTVEIERNRANAEADKSVLDAAISLLHGNEKGSIWRRNG